MKKSKFKLEFTLKQHTPMIHFQYDQDGATLRGTELKPKLDKFLIKTLGLTEEKVVDNILKTVPKEEFVTWFNSKDHLSLDYKVSIQATDVELTKITNESRLPMFFGAMGDDYALNPKATSFTDSSIKVTFQSFNNELREAIDEHFAAFMARTNFGTRQNKGYGSFFLDDGASSSALSRYPSISFKIPNNQGNAGRRQANRSQENKPDLKHVFNVINYYYQRLKSGINYCKRNKKSGVLEKIDYQHSFLKLYLSKQNLGYEWEKRWLKENFLDLTPSTTPKKYARAMLGVVGKYTFKPVRGKTCAPDDANKIYPRYEKNISVSSENVQRFKSPITFKPIVDGFDVRIYIITDEIPSELLNETFVFEEGRNNHQLSTPDTAINLDQLIKAYHVELGHSFTAYTFTGNPFYQVTIQEPNQ